MTNEHLWKTVKAVLIENFCTALNAYVEKEGRLKINYLSFYDKKVKEEQIKHKESTGRNKDMSIYQWNRKPAVEKISKAKVCF